MFVYEDKRMTLDKTLNACAVSVYTALLSSHAALPVRARSNADKELILYSTNEDLQHATGYNRFEVTRAIKRLKDGGYISANTGDWNGGTRSAKDSYVQLDPRPETKGEVLLAGERHKVRYYTYPKCLLTETNKRWSQARMGGSQFILHQAAMYLANKYRGNAFTPKSGELRNLSGLSANTYKRCFAELQDIGLLFVDDNHISVCDPYTGLPLTEMDGVDQHNPANYFTMKDGRDQRLDINIDLSSAAAVRDFIFNTLGYDGPFVEHEGNIDICCPRHGDTKPSLSVALGKKACWYCHGCGLKGSFLDLCAQFGTVKYRQPDSRALGIYTYTDDSGDMLYQVLRYPNKTTGEKHFSTRQGDLGDYKWDRKDIPRTLFNRHLLKYADTVVITEGEKDATTVTELFRDQVIGTTSGGAKSWSASFTKMLADKRCIVMTDADSEGRKFEADIVASLTGANIAHHVVNIGDLGCKDVSEYVQKHSSDPAFPEELTKHLGILKFEAQAAQATPQAERHVLDEDIEL
jgi:5S rRNA maturation endonuclease (ribonuclease M5)